MPWHSVWITNNSAACGRARKRQSLLFPADSLLLPPHFFPLFLTCFLLSCVTWCRNIKGSPSSTQQYPPSSSEEQAGEGSPAAIYDRHPFASFSGLVLPPPSHLATLVSMSNSRRRGLAKHPPAPPVKNKAS